MLILAKIILRKIIMKIIHISDLHLCGRFKLNNIAKTKQILSDALETGFDHLVITGDLSDNAEEKDYLILRNILEKFNLLRSDRTSIVIGNHDIFGGVQTALDVINFPNRCIHTNYQEKVKTFTHYFRELFENTIRFDDNYYFPYAKIVEDAVLIGINSISDYSKLRNPFASNGSVNKKELEGFAKVFENPLINTKKKIALIHHHFYKNNMETKSSESSVWNKIESYTMKLRGKKKLMKYFVDHGIELVLHGHSHELKEYYRKGIKFLNAGGSIDGTSETESSYYMIELNNPSIDVSLKTIKTIPPIEKEYQDDEILAPAYIN